MRWRAPMRSVVARRCSSEPASRADAVRAIGAHGQTVRHRPRRVRRHRLHAAAEQRRAAGRAERHRRRLRLPQPRRRRRRPGRAAGAGVPPRDVRRDAARRVAVLNLGGIANLTRAAAPTAATIGFDCGPGNALLDLWCERHTRPAFDADGALGRRRHGRSTPLLAAMLRRAVLRAAAAEEHRPRPVQRRWLDAHAGAARRRQHAPAGRAGDAGRADRAAAARRDLSGMRRERGELLVCGGGALNGDLMRRLAALPAGVRCGRADERGLAGRRRSRLRVRLAGARIRRARSPATCAGVTGARGPRVLGALYPADIDGGRAKAKAARRRPCSRSVDEALRREKLEPQPQVVVAFGFLITNCAPCRSSL